MPAIVISDKPGQLGNMLFLFAHFIGRAIENNFQVINPAFDNYARYFPSLKDDFLCRYPAQKSRFGDSEFVKSTIYKASNVLVRTLRRLGGKLGPVRALTITEWDTTYPLNNVAFLETLSSSRLIFVRGWLFRDQEMVNKHAETIRRFFEPLGEHQRNVAALIKRARVETDVLIGVHIRHGFIDFENMRQYYYEAEEYGDMMERARALFPGQRVNFLICSDRKQNPEVFSRFNFLFGNDHVLEDMYSFAQCDYILGPPSTYTMWASFYGKVPLALVSDPKHSLTLSDFTRY